MLQLCWSWSFPSLWNAARHSHCSPQEIFSFIRVGFILFFIFVTRKKCLDFSSSNSNKFLIFLSIFYFIFIFYIWTKVLIFDITTILVIVPFIFLQVSVDPANIWGILNWTHYLIYRGQVVLLQFLSKDIFFFFFVLI